MLIYLLKDKPRAAATVTYVTDTNAADVEVCNMAFTGRGYKQSQGREE
jgi:hypothetical protein